MIVQNVSADGTTDMTFTVGKADLPRAPGDAGRGAGRRSATPRSWPTRTSPRSAWSASACAATPASPTRCSSALADKGINIQVISTSEIKVSVLIAAEYTELAVRALHTAYGLDAA